MQLQRGKSGMKSQGAWTSSKKTSSIQPDTRLDIKSGIRMDIKMAGARRKSNGRGVRLPNLMTKDART
jgi:hypothetical protein